MTKDRKIMAIHIDNLDKNSLIVLLNGYAYALKNNFDDVVIFGEGFFKRLCDKENGISYASALDTLIKTIPCFDNRTSPIKSHVFLGDASSKIKFKYFQNITKEREDISLVTNSCLKIPYGKECLAFYNNIEFEDIYDGAINICDNKDFFGKDYDNFYISSTKDSAGKKVPGIMCFELSKEDNQVELDSYALEKDGDLLRVKDEATTYLGKRSLVLSKRSYNKLKTKR